MSDRRTTYRARLDQGFTRFFTASGILLVLAGLWFWATTEAPSMVRALGIATPILLAALGELVVEKAGVLDKLMAPIIVYDGKGGAEAAKVAQAIVNAGQKNVLVLSQGLVGWQAAGYSIESATPALVKVAYVPKPRPGSIPAVEFQKIAANPPAGLLILDVRNQDEANAGMIKGAMLIPDEELAARMGELPKDRKIVTHCATGVRAEMAYHKLKDAGYQVQFLNADIEIAKDGKFKLTPRI